MTKRNTHRPLTPVSAPPPPALAPLAPEWTFVLQFRSSGAQAGPSFDGRVEHLRSGRTGQLHSPEELLAFLRRELETGARDPGETAD